jgi:hypothetical protein
MKAQGGVDLYTHIFLTSAQFGGEWTTSSPCLFTFREKAPGTHLIRGWVGPRAGLDCMEDREFLLLTGLELLPLGPPARKQSLHQIRYPGS